MSTEYLRGYLSNRGRFIVLESTYKKNELAPYLYCLDKDHGLAQDDCACHVFRVLRTDTDSQGNKTTYVTVCTEYPVTADTSLYLWLFDKRADFKRRYLIERFAEDELLPRALISADVDAYVQATIKPAVRYAIASTFKHFHDILTYEMLEADYKRIYDAVEAGVLPRIPDNIDPELELLYVAYYAGVPKVKQILHHRVPVKYSISALKELSNNL